MKKLFFALALVLAIGTVFQAKAQTTYTDSLSGTAVAPAFPIRNPLTGSYTFYGGMISGTATGDLPGSFILLVEFEAGSLIDPTNGIYGSNISYPHSIFSLSDIGGRKNRRISGAITSGYVTYKLNPMGTAEVISVSNGVLTILGSKGFKVAVYGSGILNYGEPVFGQGTVTLSF